MNETEPAYSICYWLDVADVIVDVGAGWEDFAQENAADNLDARQVIGRNLLDFVSGDTTKMYVRTILDAARLLRRPLVRPYRCDSPDTRRYMEMRLAIEDSGLLKWEHRLVRTETLRRRLDFRQAVASNRARRIVRCSMCNRIKSAFGWSEPDLDPLPDVDEDGIIPVIYGVCHDCLAAPLKPKAL